VTPFPPSRASPGFHSATSRALFSQARTALRSAPHVLRERFRITRGGGQPIETRGVVAEVDEVSGELRVWSSTQEPHTVRETIAMVLDRPHRTIRVIAPDTGGGFGAKLNVYPEEVLVPWLALRLRRPVKWVETRREHLLSATQERDQVHDVEFGFDGDGRIVALRDRFLHDMGAYSPRGGAVPHNYIPSVEKGVRSQMERGLVAGHKVVDLRVTLVDGKAHSVDSSDAAFQTAGSLALREAAEKGQVLLLEPVDDVTIRVPDAFVGAVMSDLSSRRGRVLGTEADPNGNERTLVRAEVPATELVRYAVELRAMTSGAGTFSRTFVRYDPMPAHLAEAVRKDHAASH